MSNESEKKEKTKIPWKNIIITSAITSVVGMVTVEGFRSILGMMRKNLRKGDEQDELAHQQAPGVVGNPSYMGQPHMAAALQFQPQLTPHPSQQQRRRAASAKPSGGKFVTRGELVSAHERLETKISGMLEEKFAEVYPEEE